MPRDRIELPTRGFSVLRGNATKDNDVDPLPEGGEGSGAKSGADEPLPRLLGVPLTPRLVLLIYTLHALGQPVTVPPVRLEVALTQGLVEMLRDHVHANDETKTTADINHLVGCLMQRMTKRLTPK